MAFNRTEIEKDVSAHRADIVEQLVQFSRHDVLLFWDTVPDLRFRQEQNWRPILQWLKEALNFDFQITESLETPECNCLLSAQLEKYFSRLSLQKLTALYIAAMQMRSVLLALAMVEGRISAQQAFELSALEELYQAEKWGNDFEAEQRRESVRSALAEVEEYLK